ncbi:hypothetical protein TNCV_4006421 [Trichonephila clavipes]|nr:hypothetical protein TNCV_4006421 [Trichonephila clavipes]
MTMNDRGVWTFSIQQAANIREPMTDVSIDGRPEFPNLELAPETWSDSLERQGLKKAWNKLWSDLEGEKYFNDVRREEITDFVQSIPGFQELDEDVETWMACDAEDCVFQMLNDDEIVTSAQEESDNETDEDKDNNSNESSKGPSNVDAFSALETAMEQSE